MERKKPWWIWVLSGVIVAAIIYAYLLLLGAYKFVQLFKDLEITLAELPVVTRIIFQVSMGIEHHFYVSLVLLMAIIAGFLFRVKDSKFSRRLKISLAAILVIVVCLIVLIILALWLPLLVGDLMIQEVSGL